MFMLLSSVYFHSSFKSESIQADSPPAPLALFYNTWMSWAENWMQLLTAEHLEFGQGLALPSRLKKIFQKLIWQRRLQVVVLCCLYDHIEICIVNIFTTLKMETDKPKTSFTDKILVDFQWEHFSPVLSVRLKLRLRQHQHLILSTFLL